MTVSQKIDLAGWHWCTA